MPLPGIFLQMSSSATFLKYNKYLDSTDVDLAKIKHNNLAEYTLKDLEASGMNKVFDGVDTSGLPDQLIHPRESQNTNGGSVQEVERKNSRHLNDLDDVFVRMLDHNTHGKDKPFTKIDIATSYHLILLEIIDERKIFYCFFIYSKKTRSQFFFNNSNNFTIQEY